MKIATWNVNSIGARLPTALEALSALGADVVCLQEIKCEDAKFPRGPIEDLGYHVETFGQKTYNGVALLSKLRPYDVARGLPGFEDTQSRYIEAVFDAPSGPVRIASIYLPNGNPVETEKFAYKLAFFEALRRRAGILREEEIPCVLGGDYNVIPREEDCHDPRVWEGDALFRPESRRAYRALLNQGFVDAFLHADGRAHQYTFWDYQAGAWQRDHGIRIDHLVCSPQAADRLRSVEIFRKARALEKPSDHVPIAADFAF